jgi:DNA/RNA endonuclease G (NUC1)
MAKLRNNHSRPQGAKGEARIVRLAVFLVVLLIALVVLGYAISRPASNSGQLPIHPSQESRETDNSNRKFGSSKPTIDYLPKGGNVEIVEHKHYTLGYNEKAEQAAWVAYLLTAESLYVPNMPRAKRFEHDLKVSTHSASHGDYSNSGYTRGHLAPAGDMAFDREAMQESFLMSNMSPQLAEFNAGVWKELEEDVRDWAIDRKELYIVSGPILDGSEKYIGKNNKIAVPKSFYKIILDIYGKAPEAIAFHIPHRGCRERLETFALSIDSLEELTGFNFFAGMPNEDVVEGMFETKNWNFDEVKYQQRLK